MANVICCALMMELYIISPLYCVHMIEITQCILLTTACIVHCALYIETVMKVKA